MRWDLALGTLASCRLTVGQPQQRASPEFRDHLCAWCRPIQSPDYRRPETWAQNAVIVHVTKKRLALHLSTVSETVFAIYSLPAHIGVT